MPIQRDAFRNSFTYTSASPCPSHQESSYKYLLLFTCPLSVDYLASYSLKNKRAQEVQIASFHQLIIILSFFPPLLEGRGICCSFEGPSSRWINFSLPQESLHEVICLASLSLIINIFPYKHAPFFGLSKSFPSILPLLAPLLPHPVPPPFPSIRNV